MPLFKSRPENGPDTQVNHQNTTPARNGSIFSGRRSRSPLSDKSSNVSPANRSTSNSTSFFGRRSSSSDSSARAGWFGGNSTPRDPTIMAARQKVTDAEEAEKEADRALSQARSMVREAREHVKTLEKEASEDARRAKAKQAEARVVSKTARALGRHGSR